MRNWGIDQFSLSQTTMRLRMMTSEISMRSQLESNQDKGLLTFLYKQGAGRRCAANAKQAVQSLASCASLRSALRDSCPIAESIRGSGIPNS